ncbi:Mitogen-activated protein kinase kinase 1 interacting [Ancylostoma caninum]|uniref:Mitogen-activated protein kinase kinase 1 interacting n=1 Tax=Ancylostoma caninum TaxID=29170 RepID=A0A368G6F9_ANCCA|nr:Mitogen-activated protein kinase kinase 1 interacting [Ancylostoma caninum]
MEIGKSLRRLLDSIPGASSIFLTDRDGVIVLSVGEELRSRASLISSLQATQDQTGKLVMGAHHASAFFYENSQLVILNVPPLTAFVVASPSANTGMLFKLREQLEPLVQEVEGIVPEIPCCELICSCFSALSEFINVISLIDGVNGSPSVEID